MHVRTFVTLVVVAGTVLTGMRAAAVDTHNPPIQYECYGAFAFDAWHFENGRAEERDGRKARALRRLLASYPEMSQSGWRGVGSTKRYAQFVTRNDEDHFQTVLLRREDTRWRPFSWGDCTPEAALDDVSIVEWALDPESPPPLPDDRVIHALINERACHGFSDPLDRMKDPLVFYEEDRIYIVLSAEPLRGAQTCPGTPPVKYDIHLDEPVGFRELFDAGTYPPQPAQRTLP